MTLQSELRRLCTTSLLMMFTQKVWRTFIHKITKSSAVSAEKIEHNTESKKIKLLQTGAHYVHLKYIFLMKYVHCTNFIVIIADSGGKNRIFCRHQDESNEKIKSESENSSIKMLAECVRCNSRWLFIASFCTSARNSMHSRAVV